MNLRDWKLCVSSNVRRFSDRTQFETTSCSAAIPVRIWCTSDSQLRKAEEMPDSEYKIRSNGSRDRGRVRTRGSCFESERA